MKAARVDRERSALHAAAGHNVCALKIPGVCTFYRQGWHELVGRAQGGSKTDPRNLAPACNACNGWCEDNPTVAYRNRWKVRQVDAVVGDRGLVPASPNPFSLAELEGGW